MCFVFESIGCTVNERETRVAQRLVLYTGWFGRTDTVRGGKSVQRRRTTSLNWWHCHSNTTELTHTHYVHWQLTHCYRLGFLFYLIRLFFRFPPMFCKWLLLKGGHSYTHKHKVVLPQPSHWSIGVKTDRRDTPTAESRFNHTIVYEWASSQSTHTLRSL